VGQPILQQVEPVEIPEFNFIAFFMDTDKLGVYHWVYYVLIYAFLVYIYNKVFRTRKLPILKNAVVYLIIAVGAFVLLIFQVDAGLPIVYCLGIAVALMLMVRIRYFLEDRKARKE
jgi:4-hydroxybenzoate polyprenyltransferase